MGNICNKCPCASKREKKCNSCHIRVVVDNKKYCEECYYLIPYEYERHILPFHF